MNRLMDHMHCISIAISALLEKERGKDAASGFIAQAGHRSIP